MSENQWPRVGDKVKVTYEGTVTAANDLLRRHFDVDGKTLYNTRNITVEVLKRTFRPTTVVRLSAGVAVRTDYGDWFWVNTGGRSSTVDDKLVSERLADGKATILYDPPSS